VSPRRQPVSGVQVVLIPEKNRDRADLFKSVFSGPDGRFTIAGIPPGDYRLIAWEAVEPYGFFAPDVLREADEKGKPVRIDESSALTVDVVPTP